MGEKIGGSASRWDARVRPVAIAWFTSSALFVVILTVSSCRGRTTDDPEPVAECQEYEHLFARCMHVDAAISTQPEALAKTDEDRERIRKICSTNLVRLRESCR